MKIEKYSMDCWYLLPTITYYNDLTWNGSRSIDLRFLNWGVSFIIQEKKWD